MSLSTEQHDPNRETAAASVPSRRERVRFAGFEFSRTPSGQCSAGVTLEWEGATHNGRSTGQSSALGDLRVSAEAALRALEDFTRGALHFDLLGIRHVRAFDSNLMIVSVALREGAGMTRLVGCYLADTDTCHGAAMAVLNATNRVLGNHVFAG